MNTSPVIVFPPSNEAQGKPAEVRSPSPANTKSGAAPIKEIGQAQNSPSTVASEQDVVKVQLEPPDDIAVYQFVNQQGTLVLQVPPQPVLNLALEISQELAAEAAPKVPPATAGGKTDGS